MTPVSGVVMASPVRRPSSLKRQATVLLAPWPTIERDPHAGPYRQQYIHLSPRTKAQIHRIAKGHHKFGRLHAPGAMGRAMTVLQERKRLARAEYEHMEELRKMALDQLELEKMAKVKAEELKTEKLMRYGAQCEERRKSIWAAPVRCRQLLFMQEQLKPLPAGRACVS